VSWNFENMKRLILFNASVLTSYGTFRFELLSFDEAREIVHKYKKENKEIVSAVGHQATAEVMSEILEFTVEKKRLNFSQNIDEAALIFKLKTRAEEGEILSRAEIEEIGYEFGLLTKIE